MIYNKVLDHGYVGLIEIWGIESSNPRMAGAVVEIKAPYLVLSEWNPNRSQCYGQSVVPYEYYMPTHPRAGSDCAATWLKELQAHYESGEALYRGALSAGIPEEIARISISMGHYIKIRASADVFHWSKFLQSTSDQKVLQSKADQTPWETQQYIVAICSLMESFLHNAWRACHGR